MKLILLPRNGAGYVISENLDVEERLRGVMSAMSKGGEPVHDQASWACSLPGEAGHWAYKAYNWLPKVTSLNCQEGPDGYVNDKLLVPCASRRPDDALVAHGQTEKDRIELVESQESTFLVAKRIIRWEANG